MKVRWLPVMLLLLCACAAKKPLPSEDGLEHDSRIEIEYQLGHANRSLQITAVPDQILAKSYRQAEVTQEMPVAIERYREYFRQIRDYLSQPRRDVASSAPCRSPFKVRLALRRDVQVREGCRDGSDSGLGRLIQSGEFLLFQADPAPQK